MSALTEKVAALLSGGIVTKVIGYEEGNKKPRPLFCESAEDAQRLIYDSRCMNNLAVYLTKPELLGTGKVAVVATIPVLRSIIQLSVEHQLKEDKFVFLTVNQKGEVIEFSGFDAMSEYLVQFQYAMEKKEQEMILKLEGMTREERWAFWMQELSQCFKCYACRAACPLCYCTRCIVEVNCPQWIQPWAAPIGNFEWQINRAMHLAGRCTGCGACGEACPVGIPIHLLTHKMMEDIGSEFGLTPGQTAQNGNVLSTFNVGDKENFIH